MNNTYIYEILKDCKWITEEGIYILEELNEIKIEIETYTDNKYFSNQLFPIYEMKRLYIISDTLNLFYEILTMKFNVSIDKLNFMNTIYIMIRNHMEELYKDISDEEILTFDFYDNIFKDTLYISLHNSIYKFNYKLFSIEYFLEYNNIKDIYNNIIDELYEDN